MRFSKVTKEIEGITYEALRVDREDESIPQAFTLAEIESIKQNTITHQQGLIIANGKRPYEYSYYLTKDQNGDTFIDRALTEHDLFLSQCNSLNIV